jgi:ankyrin repeat protein/beta-lactamase regulating signal transducer with metallopeptidase domain
MENYLTQIINYLLTQSWQIAVLVVVIAAATLLLKNKSAHIRYLLWLIVLAKCLVPPLFTIPLAVLPQERYTEPVPISPAPMPRVAFEAADMDIAKPTLSTSTPVAIPSRPTVTEKLARLTMHQWLALVWITGAIVFTIAALIKALRTNFWLWQQRKQLPVEIQSGIEDLFYSLDFRTFPKVWMIEGIGQPFVWGLLRGSIYLPADFVKVNSSEHRRSVLGHELSHFLRFDAAVNILQIIAQAVFWFHPFVWWANKKIRAEREKCCDEMAIARLGAKATDYSSAIVNILISEHKSTRPVPSLAVAGPVKNIEERIKTMLRPGKKFYKRPSLLAAITVLLVAFSTVPTAFVLCARSETKAAVPPLHKAVANGNLEQVRLLITRGASVNAKDSEGRTPLFYAVENDHILMFDLLIAKGADIDAKDKVGDTPLHHAARLTRHHDWRLAAELARRGADVNATNNRRQTPLHVALQGDSSGHRHVASHLLGYDVNVNARDSNGKTALHLAAQRAVNLSRRFIRQILAKGADVTLTDARGQTALHIACDYNSKAQDVINTIIERANGVNLNVVDSDNVTPLHIAALRGRTDACETLIANGAKIDAKDKNRHTPAYHAVRAGNIETADSLIKKGADISSIHLSAYKGNLSNLKTLLTRGASVNEKDETGFTALHAAAAGGHRDVVEYLISQGADVKAEGGPGWTALSYAARDNAKEVVELLRSKGVGGGKEVSRILPVVIERGYADMASILVALGADINFNNGKPLIMAARHGHKKIVELLISKGADVNAGEDQSALHAAATSGRIDIAECLIAAGADVNGKGEKWWSPLGNAIANRHKRMVEFLLSKGAAVNKGRGWLALQDAIDCEYQDIAKLLIEHGADVNAGGGYGALDLAAWYEPEFVELLIDSGANVNAIGDWGWTPLHWSVYGNNRDAFDLLVSRGADVNARTNTKETVLHLLIQWGRNAEQVEFVLSRGVDINAADACGWTALHRAVLYNRPEIAKLLIAKGADVNLKDSDGRTPLVWAKDKGHKEIVALLRKHGAKE